MVSSEKKDIFGAITPENISLNFRENRYNYHPYKKRWHKKSFKPYANLMLNKRKLNTYVNDFCKFEK